MPTLLKQVVNFKMVTGYKQKLWSKSNKKQHKQYSAIHIYSSN